MKCGVVVFPGSNCDHDVYHVLRHVLGESVQWLWHNGSDLQGCELVVLPGGFSYGDYLRAGALASLSPMMGAVRRHADNGGLILGICNGFQVLIEAGLLPGALRRNRNLRFECRDVFVRVERTDLPFTSEYAAGQVLRMPIAHAEGNFHAGKPELDRLEVQNQIVLRYVSPQGQIDAEWNINGSSRSIAGIVNREGHVLGMMPHPERCAEEILGCEDGLALLAGTVAGVAAAASV